MSFYFELPPVLSRGTIQRPRLLTVVSSDDLSGGFLMLYPVMACLEDSSGSDCASSALQPRRKVLPESSRMSHQSKTHFKPANAVIE